MFDSTFELSIHTIQCWMSEYHHLIWVFVYTVFCEVILSNKWSDIGSKFWKRFSPFSFQMPFSAFRSTEIQIHMYYTHTLPILIPIHVFRSIAKILWLLSIQKLAINGYGIVTGFVIHLASLSLSLSPYLSYLYLCVSIKRKIRGYLCTNEYTERYTYWCDISCDKYAFGTRIHTLTCVRICCRCVLWDQVTYLFS